MFLYLQSLNNEIKLQILRKLLPEAYVKIRRSCQFFEKFCEKHRNFIGIHCYRRTAYLYLTNSIKKTYPLYKSLTSPEYDISTPYALLQYGTFAGDSNLKIPMIKKNIPVLRAAISGFQIKGIRILNHFEGYDETFSEALIYFLEATADLDPTSIEIKNISREKMDLITWDLVGITMQNLKSLDLLKNNRIEKIPIMSFDFNWYHDIEIEEFVDLVKDKNTLFLSCDNCLISWSEKVLKSLSQYWNLIGKCPTLFDFTMEDVTSFYHDDLAVEELPFSVIDSSIYLGSIVQKQLPFAPNLSKRNIKFDYWIVEQKNSEKKYVLLCVRRCLWTTYSTVTYRQAVFCEEKLNQEFIAIFQKSFNFGYAIDASLLFEQLEKRPNPEEKMKEIQKYSNFIKRFYGRKYKKCIVNLISEIIRDGLWDGSRWLLELKDNEFKSKAKRNRWSDMAKVLFQELFCPIYCYIS